MKSTPQLFSLFIIALLVGCGQSASQPQSSATISEQKADDKISRLGDQLATLSDTDASELSKYLSDIYGIVPAGKQPGAADDRRQKSSFAAEIVMLGDQIASLSLVESTTLSEYLSAKHGIAADN